MFLRRWRTLVSGVVIVAFGIGALVLTGDRPEPILIVVVDASYSLAVPPSKLETLTRSLMRLLEPEQKRWRIAMVVGRDENLDITCSRTVDTMRQLIAGLGTPRGGSVVWRAVEEGARLVSYHGGDGVMVVFTDGIPLAGGATAEDAIRACRRHEVPAIVVRLGTEAPLPPLVEVARLTGGIVIDLPEPTRLENHVEFLREAAILRAPRPGAIPQPTWTTWGLWAVLSGSLLIVFYGRWW